MYRIYEKTEAIKRVQTYLKEVSKIEGFVVPSEIYDEVTRKSVIYFQAENDLEVTGEVNKATFDLLYKLYKEQIYHREIRKTNHFNLIFPIKKGDFSTEINYLNYIMSELLDYYRSSHSLRRSNFFSDESVRAVVMLRKIYMLPYAEYIDEALYVRMIDDYNGINNLISI